MPDGEIYLKIKNGNEGKQQIITIDRNNEKRKAPMPMEPQYQNYI